jgi:hypothetical protein
MTTAQLETDFVTTVRTALQPYLGKKRVLSPLPPKYEAAARSYILPPQHRNDQIIAFMDLTTFGSGKEGIAFTPTHVFAKELDDRVAISLTSIGAIAKRPGVLRAKLAVRLTDGGSVEIPVGTADEAMVAIVEAIVEARRDPRFVDAVANAGDAAALDGMAELQQELQANMITDEAATAINAAARLLVGKKFRDAIIAYTDIGRRYPERRGVCESQIGAAHYFLGEFQDAVAHYMAAKQLGADSAMMDENINEALDAMAKR